MKDVKPDTSEDRSPLPYKPLRLPGESVHQQILKVMEDKVEPNAVAVGVAVALAGYAWINYFLKTPPLTEAVIATLAALGATLYALPKFSKARAELRQLKQGRDGERIVAEQLDALRERGCHIIHDFTGDSFNIDHIVIGPQGVFTIETKTLSKPRRGQAKITYDGETVRVGGYTPDRDPIGQAKHQAGWLKRHLREATGEDFRVRPVVVYPGWFVQRTVKASQVWVLEPKQLKGFIKHEPVTLEKADIHLASSRLKSYMRAYQS